MSTYKKKTVTKYDKNLQWCKNKFQSYCLMCKKFHHLNSECNRANTLFVKYHMIKMFNQASTEQKLKLIKIVQDTRIELLTKIENEIPELIDSYIENNDHSKVPYTPLATRLAIPFADHIVSKNSK